MRVKKKEKNEKSVKWNWKLAFTHTVSINCTSYFSFFFPSTLNYVSQHFTQNLLRLGSHQQFFVVIGHPPPSHTHKIIVNYRTPISKASFTRATYWGSHKKGCELWWPEPFSDHTTVAGHNGQRYKLLLQMAYTRPSIACRHPLLSHCLGLSVQRQVLLPVSAEWEEIVYKELFDSETLIADREETSTVWFKYLRIQWHPEVIKVNK